MSVPLELFGDRWSLLIVRDLMVRGYRTFKEFQQAGEGIASNVLSARLRKLQAGGIVQAGAAEGDARRVEYRLTAKGIELAPVLLEMLIWGARHEHTGAPPGVMAQLERNRGQVLAEARRRWETRDLRPLIPRFDAKPPALQAKRKPDSERN